jgi:hypothetical protein
METVKAKAGFLLDEYDELSICNKQVHVVMRTQRMKRKVDKAWGKQKEQREASRGRKKKKNVRIYAPGKGQ